MYDYGWTEVIQEEKIRKLDKSLSFFFHRRSHLGCGVQVSCGCNFPAIGDKVL